MKTCQEKTYVIVTHEGNITMPHADMKAWTIANGDHLEYKYDDNGEAHIAVTKNSFLVAEIYELAEELA